MSIFKRGRVYWFHFIFNGRHYQRTTKQRNPRTARQIEAAFKTALAKGEVGITERQPMQSFREAMKAFLTWSEHEHANHLATYRRYLTSSKPLVSYFRDTRLDQITAQQIESYKVSRLAQTGERTGRKLKPATVNRELACGKASFNHAKKAHRSLPNPFSEVNFYAENNEQTRVLTFQEEAMYLNAASQPLRDIVTLMLQTGMRPEEVYRIQSQNVHLDQQYLYNPFGKTKAARRKVRLTSEARRVLAARLETSKGEYLFPCETDSTRPIPKINNAHDRLFIQKSKDKPAPLQAISRFRLYDLRHTWATRAAMSGVDLVTLAAMLGHSRIQMVLRYAHPTDDHQAKAMWKVEEFCAAQQIVTANQQQNLGVTVQ